MPATKGTKGGGGGGLASKLFNKFDSDRKYDPFLDTDPVIQDCKIGMEALLSMCNAVEINSIFGALGFVVPCPRSAKEQQIMAYIREGGRQVEKKFADVLKFCWEGLLYEYLRTVGCPLRDREHDPRHFVMRYWRRSMLDPTVKKGFVPFYAKREIKSRNNIMQEDKDIRDIRAGLTLREELVKDAEARTRGQHDYRFVLQYFSASRDLHRTLVANVNYLANEVEQLRANMDHNSESISIMETQFVELETKYDRVVGGLVHRGAFQLTIESALYGMINEGHTTIKNAERIANELLDSMETGPERYDKVDDTVNKNGPSPAEPTAPGRSAVNSATRLQEQERSGGAAADHEKWAAPRSRAGPNRPSSSSNHEKLRENERAPSSGATTAEAAEEEEEAIAAEKMSKSSRASPCDRRDDGVRDVDRRGDLQLSLELCLGQVLETHRRTCARYANQVADLKAKNAGLAATAAEASRLEAEAAAEARSWEAKHDALEGRLAEVEVRSREELARAEERADEERSQSLEVANLLKETLERATPTLLELVAGFAPRDTEGPGVALFRSLGIGPDLYVHVVAAKRMFQADLESRAREIVDAEREIALAEAEAAEQEEAAAAASGGKKKKGERGRPKTREKGGGGVDKGKSGGSKSKSRSKPAAGKGAKKSSEKSSGKTAGRGASKETKKAAGKGAKVANVGDKTSSKAQGGAGKENKEAGKKLSSADDKRSQSPAKKGGAGKGGKKKK